MSHADPDHEGDPPPDAAGGTLFTPGVNLWLGRLNRLAISYEIWNPQSGETARSVETMSETAF
ncbi:MAG TPA: hypothetical protein VFR37_21215 [Longimicrobium sp.]|nr:hypothetical protein [Longimicrobium sp.]